MKKSRGFTLVELIVVMVVTGILAGGMTVFFLPVIKSYLAVGRRAGLTDMADGVVRTISRDIRSAVPNSIRQPNGQCFEVVPTSTGGRFRTGPDIVWDAANPGSPSMPVSDDIPTTAFDVTTQLESTPTAGDWVVINNQNGDEVYAGTNRAAIGSVSTSNEKWGKHRITLAAAKSFLPGYEGGRFVIVPNAQQAVFHVCAGATGGPDANGNGRGTLYRFSGYGFNPASPGACPTTYAAASVLATHVEQCTFTYNPNPGAAQDAGYVQVQIKLTDHNESVRIQFGTHADNVP
ncbi:prepilin-type N-terminal cleavage/methylation domain-containing protein [Pseudoduganella sp. LjRoot289]|uniref:PulJ/GspJ family protein n=1 Tax=Pseudoduganella sp. LjRoot289 TaxID=3342314 RepID=UPI003ECDC9D7